MKDARWQEVSQLYFKALELPENERDAFLRTCKDEELRQEVLSLLANETMAQTFLERPVLEMTPGSEMAKKPSLIGRQLGSYHVVSDLGRGGMGEVYRAEDQKLGRDVAIKVLPKEFAVDPERLVRFRREARTLASLNHPNIAAIYGLEESEEVDYLVLELVEGDTLHGPLPLVTALDYACQVAEALEAAHEHGIIHRDLKPANVKVTPQGRIKVLDFGLAKAIWGTEVKPDLSQSAETGNGIVTDHILGTPGYMSPEQARGGEVDQRTDIWAFGCLLYELLAGKRAFHSETVSQTIAAVLEHEPEWKALPAKTPAKVRDLLRRCLQKDANRRLNNIADALATIQEVRSAQARRTAQRVAAAPGRGRRPAAGRIHALAVLPLTNLAGDPEQDYLADGMTDALITELAQIRALRVISRTSAMHYKGTTKTVPEIARELGVDGIVEGSVMRAGDRLRITAQLIHAASDRHLWAHSYARDLRDVLQLQSEVAQTIADEIQVTLTPQERARLSRVRQVNVESHEAYLRGHYHWGRAQPDRSIENFQRAIAIDPDNAPAYAGVADAQCMLISAVLQAAPPAQIAPLARAAALRALELDESLAEPHVSLARVLFWHDRDPVGAERELRRAIQKNPNCAMAHLQCGILFGDLQRSNESAASFRRALQLDPVSCWNSSIAGWCLYEIGQEEAGKQHLQKAIELDANLFLPWTASSFVHCYEGKFAEAIAEAAEGVRLSSGLPLARSFAAYALAMAGRHAEARAIVDQLEELSRERYVPASARMWYHVGIGDYERAIEWLENGYPQRDGWLPHLGMFRALKPLHAYPRFQDLLRRLGLAH